MFECLIVFLMCACLVGYLIDYLNVCLLVVCLVIGRLVCWFVSGGVEDNI